ncbi:unnamed protein product, partial [Pylaiella littoralis]
MDPSRLPGRNPGHNRLRKPDPSLAPAVPVSEHTRTIPAPRGVGDSGGGACSRKAAEDDADKEEPCCICCTQLPDVGRGIIPCGHVFCFCCIHTWSKKANVCPTCRLEFTKITMTMSSKDLIKEEARKAHDKKKRTNKRQFARTKRKAARVKNPVEGVYVKVFRVRKKTQNLTSAQQAALPHPQAPGGHLHGAGGVVVDAAAGVGVVFMRRYPTAHAQRAHMQVQNAAERAREEAAEARSRARAARKQAVAARQQAVRAAELAAKDNAPDVRNRTAEEEDGEEEEEEEEGSVVAGSETSFVGGEGGT